MAKNPSKKSRIADRRDKRQASPCNGQPRHCSADRCIDCRRLCEKEVATILGCSTSKLQKARVKGTGLGFIKDGGSVRYPECEILAYKMACYRTSTSDNGGRSE